MLSRWMLQAESTLKEHFNIFQHFGAVMTVFTNFRNKWGTTLIELSTVIY